MRLTAVIKITKKLFILHVRIPTSRLYKILRTLGLNPTEEEVLDIILEVDQDGNGFIDFIEFLQMMKKLWGIVDTALVEAFHMFDEDGSGTVDLDELTKAVYNFSDNMFSEEEIDEMVAEIDVDGDGQIDVTEFIRAMTV